MVAWRDIGQERSTRPCVGARRHPSAVAQAVEPGRHVGEQVHGFLEWEHLVLPDRFRQGRGRVVERGKQVEVRVGYRPVTSTGELNQAREIDVITVLGPRA